MRRATITLTDDLERDLERYLEGCEAVPSLAAVIQRALRQYLDDEGLRSRGYRPPSSPLAITPASLGSGLVDVAERHDYYLTEVDNASSPGSR